MKKLALLIIVALIAFSCGNQSKKQQESAEKSQVILTVDELFEKAPELVDKEIVVKGTVMHVCKEGGARCFLMGSTEDKTIRVEAGEKIGAFKQEQMGSDLEIVGILKEVKTEADAHNPAMEHGETAQAVDSARAAAHEIISNAQEAAEVVYFIEGMQVKEASAETK